MARPTPCNPDVPKPNKKMKEAPKALAASRALFAKFSKTMKIPRGARAAVDFYTGTGYIDLNRELRKPGYLLKKTEAWFAKVGGRKVGVTLPAWTNGAILHPERAAQIIADLDKTLAANGTPDDLLLFRGVSSARIRSAPVGATFSDPAYQSSSLRRDIAGAFAERAKKTGVILEIEAPKGTRGAFLSGWGGDPLYTTEHEFLLPRGTTFQVIANDGKGTVRVRIVPTEEP